MARNAAGETEERVQIIVLDKDEYVSYPNLYPDSGPANRYPDSGPGRYPDTNSGRYPDSGRYQDSGRYPDNNSGRYPDSNSGRYPDGNSDRYPDSSQGRNPDPYTAGNRSPERSDYPSTPDGGQLAGERVTPTSGSTITLECLTFSNIGQMTATWRREDK